MDNILTVGIENCCGCSACSNVCPKHCISMKPNTEGFIYPHINESLCVHCGMCLKYCPIVLEIYKTIPALTYAATSKDVKNTDRSSSGGAFFEIAKFFISYLDGYVCGCVMYDDLTVHHILTNNLKDLVRMQGSKYVQSDISDIFTQIQHRINSGTPVLFSGTPCQVAAIKSFIGKSELFYTIDTVCHGVSSPGLFKYYMDKAYHDKHLVSFRYKNPYEISTYAFSFTDGSKVNGQLDPFYNSFLRGFSFRYSCYSCKYACSERVGDITLGDCANFRDFPNLKGKPLSTILLNSGKGIAIWESVKESMLFEEADFHKESQLNHQLNSPVNKPDERKNFYSDLFVLSCDDLSKKYSEHWPFKTKIKRFLITHIPYSLRSKIR